VVINPLVQSLEDAYEQARIDLAVERAANWGGMSGSAEADG
jgi:hypothetical protein